MIDLHAHLLPGIDDGPASFEEAVEMCRLAAADGCEAMVATPHQRHPQWWNTDTVELEALRAELQQRVGSRPRLHLGAEIHCDSAILDAVDRLEATGGLCPLAASHYLLLEFGEAGIGADPEQTVHELLVAGWMPVLAHPECIPWLAEDRELLPSLVGAGACLQITAASVTGELGRAPQLHAQRLLDRGLVHFLASDCHGSELRPPGLRQAAERVARRWGQQTAWRLTEANPRAVLNDRPLQAVA